MEKDFFSFKSFSFNFSLNENDEVLLSQNNKTKFYSLFSFPIEENNTVPKNKVLNNKVVFKINTDAKYQYLCSVMKYPNNTLILLYSLNCTTENNLINLQGKFKNCYSILNKKWTNKIDENQEKALNTILKYLNTMQYNN